jgi:hypothetical protein
MISMETSRTRLFIYRLIARKFERRLEMKDDLLDRAKRLQDILSEKIVKYDTNTLVGITAISNLFVNLLGMHCDNIPEVDAHLTSFMQVAKELLYEKFNEV